MTVVKRDGRKVKFDKGKIRTAILKAFIEVDGEETNYAKEKAGDIADYIEAHNKNMTVEEIQDLVEELLMASNRKDVAKKYIIYRNNRTKIRERNTQLMKAVSEKLNATNVQNQNANMDEKSFGGRMGEASDSVMKQYALDYCMSEMSRNNHLNNEIYIHDLNSYAVGCHNCLSIPFDKLLANGFNTRQTDVRPAQSVSTAFQLVAVIFQLQSLQQFGGVSCTHLDWTMVPYVRKSFYKHFKDGMKYIEGKKLENSLTPEELSIKNEEYKRYHKAYTYSMDKTMQEVYQAVEGLYHNLNTLQSRSGNQLPFTSINYGTCTEPEGRMVTKALLEVSINGIGKLHKTSIFPCGIFQMMKGVNRKPGEPNYDLYRLALKSTAQRLYPNYANGDTSKHLDCVSHDRENKEKIINSLSKEDYNALIQRLEANPTLKEFLMLEVVDEQEEEIWRTFRNLKDNKHPYASIWEVSSLGRIKRDGKLVDLKINDWGYYALSFGAVHKIVAENFIPKTEEDIKLNRNEVDHIDGNRLNNNINNLRWCTHEENVNFPLARKNQYNSAKMNGFKGRPPKKPVLQYDIHGNFIAEYGSVLEAGEKCGIWRGGISTVLKGKQKTAGGYVWKYKKEDFR